VTIRRQMPDERHGLSTPKSWSGRPHLDLIMVVYAWPDFSTNCGLVVMPPAGPITLFQPALLMICHLVESLTYSRSGRRHSDAAAAIPLALKSPGEVILTSTGYFHSMNFAHPSRHQSMPTPGSNSLNLPQKANFLPKYFPIYGIKTIVSNSSNCCKLSLHSLSASDKSRSSSTELVSPDSGSESTSSVSGDGGSTMKPEDVIESDGGSTMKPEDEIESDMIGDGGSSGVRGRLNDKELFH